MLLSPEHPKRSSSSCTACEAGHGGPRRARRASPGLEGPARRGRPRLGLSAPGAALQNDSVFKDCAWAHRAPRPHAVASQGLAPQGPTATETFSHPVPPLPEFAEMDSTEQQQKEAEDAEQSRAAAVFLNGNSLVGGKAPCSPPSVRTGRSFTRARYLPFRTSLLIHHLV